MIDDFTERTPLKGKVPVGIASLFNDANINIKNKVYIIKGDTIELFDISTYSGEKSISNSKIISDENLNGEEVHLNIKMLHQ